MRCTRRVICRATGPVVGGTWSRLEKRDCLDDYFGMRTFKVVDFVARAREKVGDLVDRFRYDMRMWLVVAAVVVVAVGVGVFLSLGAEGRSRPSAPTTTSAPVSASCKQSVGALESFVRTNRFRPATRDYLGLAENVQHLCPQSIVSHVAATVVTPWKNGAQRATGDGSPTTSGSSPSTQPIKH